MSDKNEGNFTHRWQGGLVAFALSFAIGAAGCTTSPSLTGSTDAGPSSIEEQASVEEEIWALERSIFAGRAIGDIGPYIDVSSDQYLGWPPTIQAPMRQDGLKDNRKVAEGLEGEVVSVTPLGFTQKGDTAVAYFETHRTMLGVGMADAGDREVDQRYHNIHVWTRIDGKWELIASMPRPAASIEE